MGFTIEDILLGASILLFLSIIISKSLGRFGIPALLLFLAVGMLAGSEGIGNIHFDDARSAQSLGSVAVPIVFATYPLLAGVEKSEMIFNIVFFIVLTSVMLQGTTLTPVAKWLNLSEQEKKLKKHQFDIEMEYGLKNELTEIKVPDKGPAIGKSLVDLRFPKGALIVLINRHGKFVTPNGATVLEPKDVLYVMTDNDEELTRVNEVLGYEVT